MKGSAPDTYSGVERGMVTAVAVTLGLGPGSRLEVITDIWPS